MEEGVEGVQWRYCLDTAAVLMTPMMTSGRSEHSRRTSNTEFRFLLINTSALLRHVCSMRADERALVFFQEKTPIALSGQYHRCAAEDHPHFSCTAVLFRTGRDTCQARHATKNIMTETISPRYSKYQVYEGAVYQVQLFSNNENDPILIPSILAPTLILSGKGA